MIMLTIIKMLTIMINADYYSMIMLNNYDNADYYANAGYYDNADWI